MSTQKVGTKAFAEAVIARLGKKPKQMAVAEYATDAKMNLPSYVRPEPAKKVLQGVDVFVDWVGEKTEDLATKLQTLSDELDLVMITNRGVKVWPGGFDETFCTDHWRCRYKNPSGTATKESIPALLSKAIDSGIDVIKTENLYEFDGRRGYSLGQGQ